jgi:NTE family protein
MENHDIAVENCDIYIKPDVVDFAPTDFDAVRQMIYRGELAAREKFEYIIELAKENRSEPIKSMPYIGLIELHDYKITGLEKVTKEIITDAFDLNLPNLYTVNDLNESVEIAYSTGFFELIQYDIVSSGAKRTIEIKVVEKNYDELKVGLHYDSYFKAALLFNGSFRNLMFRDTKLDVVLSVGENPLLDARYRFDLENDFSFGTQFFVNNFDVFLYDGSDRTSTFDYTSSLLGAEMQKQLGKSYGAGFGLQTEFTYFSSVLSIDDFFGTYDIFTANAYGYLKLDTRDEPYYPESGAKSFLEAKYVANLGDNGIDTYNQGIITFSYQKFDKISEDMVISYGVDAAAGLDTNAPPQYLVYLGGFGENYLFSAIPFVGLEFLNVQGLYAWSLKAELRYELFKDNYLRFHANLGNNSFKTSSVFKISDLIFGTGLTYSYDSFIGPLEITFMNSNYQEDMQIYLKFGMGLY